MNNIDQIIGWIGAIAFMLSAIPQAYQSYRYKNSGNLNLLFLSLWFMGSFTSMFYVVLIKNLPLFCNYLVNFTCVCIILYYRLWPRPINKANLLKLEDRK